ncbi:MerR family transcriptional regulator [Chloroflexota bacterium]
MPTVINGKRYYRTAEACQIAGISRSTFFRWLRQGSYKDVLNFDRRGWRLFTKDDLRRLKAEVNQVKPAK